ncbi:hypothetical protein [Actinoplanes siamensis]|uniref:Uncharacterized protein n=1 Tax=Actinoplanes siamensis TaxID=1223317 RepID=A0A919KBQ9_9ACTN|nr:hypothetical protein [Actinoplanes siamensis]GIF02523.1 hypothetical protein Asi03nite_00610 [Actinoplanes siamensis]
MSDHWGGFDHHDDDGLPDFPDLHDLSDTHDLPDLGDHHEPGDPHTGPADPHHEEAELPDPPEPRETIAADDFPPALHVGDLPEPFDGFPWVDATTLGGADTYHPPTQPVDPHELAAYAGVDIPDGADPWTALATSDDPAVAALARWWTPDEQ